MSVDNQINVFHWENLVKKEAEIAIRYPDNSIAKNKTTLLTGRTGAGKTTLLRILLGLDLKVTGNVFFQNQRVQSEKVLEHVSFVPQNPKILVGSLRYNLTMSIQEDIKDDELIEQLTIFKLDNLIEGYQSFADVLNQPIHQEARQLSGGEIQRIGILRGLNRNKDIILLDEPTSALDKDTETIVLDYITETVKTALIVSHRPAAHQYANYVIKIDADSDI